MTGGSGGEPCLVEFLLQSRSVIGESLTAFSFVPRKFHSPPPACPRILRYGRFAFPCLSEAQAQSVLPRARRTRASGAAGARRSARWTYRRRFEIRFLHK